MTRRGGLGARLHPRHFVILFIALVLVLVARDVLFPSGFGRGEARTLVVRHGAPIDEIARDLVAAGLVKSPFTFSLLARATGTDRRLKAGQYTFRDGDSVIRILAVLARGMGGQDRITIPEGQTARDIARILEARLGTDPDGFLEAVADSAILAAYGVEGATMEGYLFPDSYEILPSTAPTTIVRMMADKARRVLEEEMAKGGPIALELDRHEILTLASIVEAEAMLARERPRIAAVYLNRLRRKMLLQADPTVAYALGGHRPRIYFSDLKVQSPYNTYVNVGLPPGPIGNPGRASIQAVLNPTPGSRELFFVARGDGSHIFTETGEQHMAAVAFARALQARAATRGVALPGAPALGVDTTARVPSLVPAPPASGRSTPGSAPPGPGGASSAPTPTPGATSKRTEGSP